MNEPLPNREGNIHDLQETNKEEHNTNNKNYDSNQ